MRGSFIKISPIALFAKKFRFEAVIIAANELTLKV
nr:MAG TPA: hypothetical protein [Caudoviricetes sp.]DAT36005.1 MAG TPA: hypothetical protein [Caudoviricetes sp.]